MLPQARGESVGIGLLHLTKHWLKNPDENLGIVIRVKTGGYEIRLDSSLLSLQVSQLSHFMFLE